MGSSIKTSWDSLGSHGLQVHLGLQVILTVHGVVQGVEETCVTREIIILVEEGEDGGKEGGESRDDQHEDSSHGDTDSDSL